MKTYSEPAGADDGQSRATRATRRKARTVQTILDAAEHQFLKNGFHLTTMESIASEADMAVGSLYFYFANKDSLYFAVVERALVVLERYLAEAFARELPPIKRLYALGDAYLRFAFEHPAYFRILIFPHTDARADGEVPSVMQRNTTMTARLELLIAGIAQALDRAFLGSKQRPISPERVARFLVGAWNGVIALYLRPDALLLDETEVKAVLDEAAWILTEGIISVLDSPHHERPTSLE